MCGILVVIAPNGELKMPKCSKKRVRSIRQLAYIQSTLQRHRGPDHTGVVHWPEEGVVFIQERLAVVCPETGDQPLKDGGVMVAANGEIYNYLEKAAEIAKVRGEYEPRSDCDVILGLYQLYGDGVIEHLSGMYAFALYDKAKKRLLVSRDPTGIIPLYMGLDSLGQLWFASEMKCLVGVCKIVNAVEPGAKIVIKDGGFNKYQDYNPKWIKHIPTNKANLTMLNQKLVSAVRSHLQSHAPFGCLLSGGVDSSLIASIATKVLREHTPNIQLRTYSVGLKDAPDFKYSRMVSEYIKSDHREVIFRIEDGIDCIREAIYHTESYDVTTVRCSIPMILMARTIKADGLKMILSGEGADEMFGGYLYFHDAPDAQQFHQELVNRVLSLNKFDCLRANKATMAHGVELRVPFLDKEFLEYTMNIRPEDKMPVVTNALGHKVARIEKDILRSAFADGYLPDEVLWRQKEQFSDGVGYSWIDTIRKYASSCVTDEEFADAPELYAINTPKTKEAFYYRCVFEEMFPGHAYARTVEQWTPRIDWGCHQDPSGRAQNVHTAAYKK